MQNNSEQPPFQNTMKTIRLLVALCVATLFSTPSLFAGPPDIAEILAKLHTPKGSEPKPKPVAAAQATKPRPQKGGSSKLPPYHTRYVTEAPRNRAGNSYSAGYIQANGPSGIYVMAPSPNTTCPRQGYTPAPQMHYVYNQNPPARWSCSQ